MYLKNIHKTLHKSFPLIFGLGMLAFPLSAQTLDEAREMIQKKDYPAAVDAFGKLMKQYGSRADVNKWYGEALYETGNFAEAEKYLSIAAKRKVTSSYPLLAAVYERDYRFKDATEYYERYKLTLKKDPAASARIDSLIAQAELCEKALNRVEEVVFIDSLIVDKSKFFAYYKLGQESGRFLEYDQLANAVPGEGQFIFESQRGDRRVFGKKINDGNFDLFETSKLHGNNWSEAIAFPDNINTAANENFPFVMTDGTTIYFASDKGPSMGGYDLYITKYNVSNGTYFTPERLPMPFNSPFNDYLLAIDEGNQVGWFASDRYQDKDKVIIYLFIPNFGQKNYYQERTPEQVRSLARIASIRETWPEDANYEKLLYTIYNTEQDFTKQKGAFVFVINDKILYYNLDDFESPQARKLYEQILNNQTVLNRDQAELDDLRRQWAKGNATTRNKIRARILQLENKESELELQIAKTETEVRNMEINYLRQRR